MQNISSLKESRVHCGHEDTFSSTRRPRTREEFGSKVGRIISNSNVDGGYWKNDFQRFPTHVAVARASEFVLGKGASA